MHANNPSLTARIYNDLEEMSIEAETTIEADPENEVLRLQQAKRRRKGKGNRTREVPKAKEEDPPLVLLPAEG